MLIDFFCNQGYGAFLPHFIHLTKKDNRACLHVLWLEDLFQAKATSECASGQQRENSGLGLI